MLVILALILLSAAFAYFYLLQPMPNIKQESVLDSAVAANAEQLLKRLRRLSKQPNAIGVLQIKNQELQGLAAIAHRSYPRLIANAGIKNKTVKLATSLALPFNINRGYLNVALTLQPSTNNIQLSKVDIGEVSFSGNLLLKLSLWAINNVIQNDLGTQVYNSIKTVNINLNMLTVAYRVPENLAEVNTNAQKGLLALRDELALFGDVNKVKFYFQKLLRFIKANPKQHDLPYYVAYLFNESYQQTQGKPGNSAMEENKNALLALVVYFGHDSFELIVGNIANLSPQEQRQKAKLIRAVTLVERNDLQQHYIYSIALELLSTVGLSQAVGEFKEFSDSKTGGSGFSFADLMADRAGTRLAMLSTQSEGSARKIQAYFLEHTEQGYAVIFPPIAGLPEEVSDINFKLFYQYVDSPKYKKMVDKIDNRLRLISLYRDVN